MFQLLHDPVHRVLMTRLYGTYVLDDIVLRDRAAVRFVERHGLTRGIMDFSSVEAIDVPIERVAQRGHEQPVLPGQQRIIVAPHALAYELGRVIAAHQLYSRKVEPLLVRSLDEAYRAFDMVAPHFEVVENNVADDLDDSLAGVLSRINETLGDSMGAARSERQQLREKLLRLLDSGPEGEAEEDTGRPPRPSGAITLSDVFNAALNRSAVTDDDLLAVCPQCRRKTTLGLCQVVAGRDTTYRCPRCESVLTTLSRAQHGEPMMSTEKAYRLGEFLVRTSVDLECPGARLPRST